jgi:transposase
MTHPYKHHGTTTLFAALDVLEEKVVGRCMHRHRHQEFVRFLNAIEAQVPTEKSVHVILDNYAARKHLNVQLWLVRPPRFAFQFAPTSCSWLNAVEGFFAKLAKRRLKRGVFQSVIDLQIAINRFVAETNNDPKPFTWTADPDKIIAAVRRGQQVLDSIHWDFTKQQLALQKGAGPNSTNTAPKYTNTSPIARSSARSSGASAAVVKKHSTKHCTACMGLRAITITTTETRNTAANT